MQKIQGAIGFTIPVQTLTNSNEVNLTPTEVMAWQKRLPSDLGQSAKKIYHAISDCNKVYLDPKDRFEILELIDTSVQHICQSLSKRYVNQVNGLTTQQLTIAHLAETLHEQMADGYKLVVELSANAPSLLKPLDDRILSTALYKIMQHFTQIILISYELYSVPPKGIWKEIHLIYQYAEKKSLLQNNHLENEYKRVLILAATYPYQRRQSEQAPIYKATEVWSTKTLLRRDLPNALDPGFLIVDFEQDKPPMFLTHELIKFSSSFKVLDVHSLLSHLKTLLIEIEPNELQARISHHQEPEYAVSSSVLRKIIKGWEIPITRSNDRTTCEEKIQISIGLISTHFYLNGQKPFQQQVINEGSENFTLTFSTLSLQEDGLETANPNSAGDQMSALTAETEKTISYPLYPCTLISESPHGYGLLWPGNTYPPMQSGEIIGLAIDEQGNRTWEICTIRWLLHLTEADFKIGVERLSKTAIAATAQLVKNSKPSGYCARCLILGSTLLIPAFPFKTGNRIILSSDTDPMLEVELTKLIDSTGVYNQFQYISKNAPINTSSSTSTSTPPTALSSMPQKGSEQNDDLFDSVWSDL
ncbi:MAG TPA: hypothetical protein VNK03_02185 [Gammaproteobacteria bacterium]|nr:hypothetical protein [Gammaproteobacteria bacterium]